MYQRIPRHQVKTYWYHIAGYLVPGIQQNILSSSVTFYPSTAGRRSLWADTPMMALGVCMRVCVFVSAWRMKRRRYPSQQHHGFNGSTTIFPYSHIFSPCLYEYNPCTTQRTYHDLHIGQITDRSPIATTAVQFII